jgi:hypothetical protein
MNEFVFLWRRPQRPPRTPQQMQETLDKYLAWFKAMEARGHLAQYGQPLEPKTGRVVKDKGGDFSDGPYAETKEIIGGYALVEVPSKQEALDVARQFMDLHRIHWPSFVGECEVRPLEQF